MSNEPRAGMNLDPEMLAAYIDKRLSPQQRAAVEAQLATGPDSYGVLVETLKALHEMPETRDSEPRTAPKVPAGTPPWWVIAAGSVAAAAIALAIVQPQWLKRIIGEQSDPRLERLVAAVGQQRYIEGRLTGGFAYGPLKSAMRGSNDLSQQNLELLAAAGELQKAVGADASSANLHRWGLAQLQLGEYDGAVTALQRAAEGDDSSGRIRTDLAAALIARAAAGRTQDLTDAVAILQQVAALPVVPDEVFFNRALALEQLGLAGAAIDAWGQAAAIEPEGSPWRAEAQRHREALLGNEGRPRRSQRVPTARSRGDGATPYPTSGRGRCQKGHPTRPTPCPIRPPSDPYPPCCPREVFGTQSATHPRISAWRGGGFTGWASSKRTSSSHLRQEVDYNHPDPMVWVAECH